MSENNSSQGKGRPTPTRKQAEAANARPIVSDRKDREAMKASRVAAREAREKARLGALMGDERYLTPRDKGPQRRFARDYVDSRLNVGEFIIPMMLIVLLLTLINDPVLQMVFLVFIWSYVIFSLIDSIFLARRVSKVLANKYGSDKVESGIKWYVGMRAMQMRALRVPKPQLKRSKTKPTP